VVFVRFALMVTTLLIVTIAVRLGDAQSRADPRDIGAIAGTTPGPARVVVIGDFGYEEGRGPQRQVLDAIRARHQRQPYHFGITVGDNFYPSGVDTRAELDRRWAAAGYPSLGVPFYATLGNHDYRAQPEEQIRNDGSTWRMPYRYYTFQAGSARFLALDTDEGTTGRKNPFRLFGLIRRPWSEAQLAWVRDTLTAQSAARWTIVYGHHPIFSDGHHGDTARLRTRGGLLDVLRQHRVDLQHHAPEGAAAGGHFLVAGGGGREARAIDRKRAVFVASAYGFAELDVDESRLAFRIMAADGRVLHEPTALTKP
jgi:tartrate-resistant acid phosphatase type 5